MGEQLSSGWLAEGTGSDRIVVVQEAAWTVSHLEYGVDPLRAGRLADQMARPKQAKKLGL